MPGAVFVNITPSVVNGQTKWELEVVNTGKKGGYGAYPNIPTSKGDTNVLMVFQIQDGQGWSFAKDAAALWVSNNGKDPTSASQVPSEIDPNTIHTSHKDQQLQFVDKNAAPGQLNYTLNFVKGGQKTSTLDPIIDNGGPGKAPMSWEFIALGMVALVAIAVLLLRPMLKSKS